MSADPHGRPLPVCECGHGVGVHTPECACGDCDRYAPVPGLFTKGAVDAAHDNNVEEASGSHNFVAEIIDDFLRYHAREGRGALIEAVTFAIDRETGGSEDDERIARAVITALVGTGA